MVPWEEWRSMRCRAKYGAIATAFLPNSPTSPVHLQWCARTDVSTSEPMERMRREGEEREERSR